MSVASEQMFDQTFVNGRRETKKPYVIILSLLLQIAAICILIAIPLIYSEALPSAQLKSTLVAPSAPTPARRDSAPVKMSKLTARQFVPPRLIAPTTVPKQVSEMKDIAPALEIWVVPSTEGNGTPSGVIFDVIGSKPSNAPPPVMGTKPRVRGGPVRIGGQVAQANLIRQVQPLYPALAKSARVQGSVEFTATISKEGEIENLQLVRGHPLLVNAAREAVSRWQYRPTLLNGQPVEVVTEYCGELYPEPVICAVLK